MALWLAHGEPPHTIAIPWNAIGTSWGTPWHGSMASSWGSPTPLPFHGMPLGPHGELHGMALWLAHGDPPTPLPFHGMPLGPLIGGFHGMALWLAHGDSLMVSHGMPLGLLMWVPWHGSMASSWGSTNGVL